MSGVASDSRLLDELARIVREAGAAIMQVYASGIDVAYKTDASPVTEADRRAEDIILQRLHEIAPATTVLSEEAASDGAAFVPAPTFFLVDPLDGTKEFINRNGEFTVNIALIRDGRPALGAVYAPALARLYLGAHGLGAFRIDEASGAKTKIGTRPRPQAGLVAVASRSHRSPETDDYLRDLSVSSFVEAGSSLKFCLIAEGAADIYPRFGRTMEWDTGAGQAVLEAAGGKVLTHPGGERLVYGKTLRGYDNPHFVASGYDG
ncbi:MAG: 3'(2'),5'-bisphosphate nucleotidase CysQ [Parvularculaceae bacterium]